MINHNENAKNIINSLKNGIVPSHTSRYLLVGRTRLINEFKRILSNTSKGIGSIKFITGEFGSGKTFMLNIIKDMAIDQNFVVCKLQLDRTFRLNKLEDLYYNIMHNLYINKEDSIFKTSFEDIFEIWINNLQNLSNEMAQKEINNIIESISKYNSSFGRTFLSFIKAKISEDNDMKNAIVSWITGEKNVPYQLKQKFEIVGNLTKVNMIDFLKAFIKLIELLGYNGLVILIDEMDVLISERKDIRSNAYTNIKYLIDSTVSGEFNNASFIFFGSEILFKDKEKSLNNNEALSQRIGKITKDQKNFIDERKPIIWLDNLSINDYLVLTSKILEIYMEVFDLNLYISHESLRNWVFLLLKQDKITQDKITVRLFIKYLLEILDIVQQNSNNNIFKSELSMHLVNGNMFFKSNISKIAKT